MRSTKNQWYCFYSYSIMFTRPLIIILLTLFLTGCQTGRIPCPKPKAYKKSAKVPKRYRNYVRDVSQKPVEEEPESNQLTGRKSRDTKYVSNVSVDEWDCPEPGKKKYLPKNVRNNVRRNYYRVLSGYHEKAADSAAIR